MFTGIVTELGTIVSTTPSSAGRRIVIDAPSTAPGMALGDSIAVNGVCLTAVELDGSHIAIDAVRETLDRSNLGLLEPGARVDLERPMPGDGRFDGHVVQGHVDGIGRVVAVDAEGTARRIRIAIPAELGKYAVEKGSITVDGVSLTVTAVADRSVDQWFEIVLIPHTLAVTVLGRRDVGDAVNLEMDVIAKYVERLVGDHR